VYVWRLPFVFVAILTTTIPLVIVVSVLLRVRTQIRNTIGRAVVTSSMVVSLAASPALVYAITEVELRPLVRAGVYVHHGAYVFLAPAVLTIVLVTASNLLFPRRPSVSATKWRFGFWILCFAFGILNFANWCSPGWCERFGFPFSYHWWSDALLVINGENVTAGSSSAAIAGNLALLLIALAVLGHLYRRAAKY
jgi:hypothetical protein